MRLVNFFANLCCFGLPDDGADVGRIGARRGIDVARWLIGNVRRCEDADDIVHRRVDG